MATAANFVQSMRCVCCICWHHFSFISRHIWCLFTPLSISATTTTATTPKAPFRHAYPGAALNSLCSFSVRATNNVYCDIYTNTPHIDMLLSRSWIDSIILIGVCCPVFSSNDKRNKKKPDTSNFSNPSSSPEFNNKKIRYQCVAYFTRRSIITMVDIAAFFVHARKNHKMVYRERKKPYTHNRESEGAGDDWKRELKWRIDLILCDTGKKTNHSI